MLVQDLGAVSVTMTDHRLEDSSNGDWPRRHREGVIFTSANDPHHSQPSQSLKYSRRHCELELENLRRA